MSHTASPDFGDRLFERLPADLRASLSPEQRAALQQALRQQWRRHAIDIRHSFGFWRWRWYFVVIAGRDRRELTRRQEKFFSMAEFGFWLGYLGFSILLGLLALYMIKSALGIDLFPNHHLGVWTWVEAHILHRV